jgi:signal peptide peptidase SppA
MPDLLRIQVPHFARLPDYAGVWAIEPTAGSAMLERYQRTDLKRHIDETPAPKRQSDAGILTAGSNQKIGVVMLAGPLMKSVGSLDEGTSTVQARRDLRRLAADPEVGAILLAIDSPGGTVAGTASLAEDIRNARKQKPVWAFGDDLMASAAYWLGSQAEKVFANDRTAMVGSIGTLAVVYDYSQAAEKEGIRTIVIGTGPLKGAGALGAEVNEDHVAYFRGLVEDAQVSFDAAVKKGRGLSDKQLADAKTGGVFGATEALDRGLIDGIKSFDAVVSELAAEARRRSRESKDRAQSSAPRRTQMEETILTTVETGLSADDVQKAIDDALAKSRQAAAAELDRQAAIAKHCGDNKELAAKAVRENWSADKTELESMKARLANGVQAFNPAIIVNGHEKNCTLDALQGAMILRSGGKLDDPCYQGLAAVALKLPATLRAGLNAETRQRMMEHAHRFANMSLFDICREALRLDGKPLPDSKSDLIRASFSSGALNDIFTTSVNARLLSSYMSSGDTTTGWTSSVDVADFKTQERPRINVGPGLTVHPRGSTAEHADYADVVESYKIRRFSRKFVVDEQDIIDDSMQAFSDTPKRFGEAAAWLRPDLVYYILLANAALGATSLPLFHADQDQGTNGGNLDASSALSSATLQAGISAMSLWRENSRNLNIRATHLLVPPSLIWTARELLESAELLFGGDDETRRGNKNVLQGMVSPVSDARLENGVTDPVSGTAGSGSATSWYLASANAHTIEVAYRSGTGRAPQVRTFVLTEGEWGMGWDINLDIGAKALDWKGLYKATA